MRERVRSLDGLRAIAVLAVFFFHVDQETFRGGFLGVDLFFVISGYLITWLLIGENARTGEISRRRFYMRRVLRLYPALLVATLGGTVVAVACNVGKPAVDAVLAVVYLTNVGQALDVSGSLSPLAHTWSLALEEQFYLVWPLVLVTLIAARRDLVRWTAGAVLAITAVYYLALAADIDKVFELLARVPVIGAGVLLALLLTRPNGERRGRRLLAPWVGAAAIVVLAAGFVLAGDHSLPVKLSLQSVVCAAVVGHLILRPRGRVGRFLESAPLVWLGERSYGFYLWHYPILVAMEVNNVARPIVALVGLPASLALCALSWRYVEQPFLRLKRRYEQPTLPATPAIPERLAA